MIEKFFLFQGIIVLTFLTGFQMKRKYAGAPALSRGVINLNLMCIEPLIVFWSVWGLKPHREILMLPVSGAMMAGMGVLGGILLNRFLKYSGRKKATFLIGSTLSNHGFTMGGFLCYLLFGEQGLAMSVIFISYFIPLIFLCVFPYARKAGARPTEIMTPLWHLKQIFLKFQTMPFYAMLTALVMQVLGVERPAWNISLDPLLLLSVGLYYATLGINFSLVSIRGTLKLNAAVAFIKFMIIPVLSLCILRWLPLDRAAGQVVMVESVMPVAVYSVVTSILFDLDAESAAAVFVVNTILFLVIILPLLMMGFTVTGR